MLKEVNKFLKALADPQRLRIVAILSNEELCVCEIKMVIGFSMATISQHLAILREAEIVSGRKEQKWIYYSIDWDSLDKNQKDILTKTLDIISNDTIIIKDKEKVEKIKAQRACSVHSS